MQKVVIKQPHMNIMIQSMAQQDLQLLLGNPAEKKAKKSPKGVYIWVVIVYNDIKKNKRGDGLNGIW